jgi:hypothetical protein
VAAAYPLRAPATCSCPSQCADDCGESLSGMNILLQKRLLSAMLCSFVIDRGLDTTWLDTSVDL